MCPLEPTNEPRWHAVSVDRGAARATALVSPDEARAGLLAGAWRLVAAGAALLPLDQSAPRAIFPGAFNPLHAAHARMAAVAAERLGAPVAFELSLVNVDKPPLPADDLQRRVAQFAQASVWLTAAATFVEKAALFPGATFVVGHDTLARIIEPRYYASERAMHEALERIAAADCRFFVFGRAAAGRFLTAGDLTLPPALADRCAGVDEQAFRMDLASRDIRAALDGAR